MYDVFYNILQPSLKGLQPHYIDTDRFLLNFSKGNIDNEHMDLCNLEKPIKTNKKIPGNCKHELGSRIKEECIALSPKTYSFKNYPIKNKENE